MVTAGQEFTDGLFSVIAYQRCSDGPVLLRDVEGFDLDIDLAEELEEVDAEVDSAVKLVRWEQTHGPLPRG